MAAPAPLPTRITTVAAAAAALATQQQAIAATNARVDALASAGVGTASATRNVESYYQAGDTFSDCLDRAMLAMQLFRTPVVQETPMYVTGLSTPQGMAYPTRTCVYWGDFFDVRLTGIFVDDTRMDVKRIVANEAVNAQWPVVGVDANMKPKLTLGHLAGSFIVTAYKFDYLRMRVNAYGLRFVLSMLEGINRPDCSGSDFRFNDVAVFHYQDAQSPKFDGCTAIDNGAMHAATCVGYHPDSPYGYRDNCYIDSPEYCNAQFYGQYNAYQTKPAVDAWFSASIIRAGQQMRFNGVLKRYTDFSGREYLPGDNAVSLTGRVAYCPGLFGRETTAVLINNIDERGAHAREMFFFNNDVFNLSLGRVTVENAGRTNSGKAVFYCASLHSGNWAPELATENATAGGALLIQTADGSGTSKLTRALTPAEIAALIGGGGSSGGGTTAPPASGGGSSTAPVVPAGTAGKSVDSGTGTYQDNANFTAGEIDVTGVPVGAKISANQGIGNAAYVDAAGAFVARYNTDNSGDSIRPAGAAKLRISLQTGGYNVLTLSFR